MDFYQWGPAPPVPHRGGQGKADGKADANAATDGDGDARDHTITNAATNTDTHPGSNADPDSCAPDLQPRLRDRDGKRGVEQPDR